MLVGAGETGPYIVVGWSAGVEIVQAFTYYFPGNVTGMAFIDGYPNYRVLEAITNDHDSSYVTSTQSSLLGLLWVLKSIEPFGVGLIVGGTKKFLPEEMQNSYTAYYRTNYFWYSQYQDIRNPNDLTSWLTQQGAGTVVPYPTAKVSLNWPDITVPLLLMPANATVNGTGGDQYMNQMLKYQQKATNSKVDILPGTHEIVYEQPSEVVSRLLLVF